MFFACFLQLQAQQMNNMHEGKMNSFMHQFDHSDTVKIAIFAYNGMTLEDFAGPIEVFSKAKNLTNNHYKIYIVGLDNKMVESENNLVKIQPDYTITTMPACDYFFLPGASIGVVDQLRANKNFQSAWISWKKRTDTSKLVSICTAAYFLGQQGLLDGKKATTHFFVAEDFAQLYPKVTVEKNVRFVDAGNILTSSGVTSGIDLALYIVGNISGANIQAMISRALQYNFHQDEVWPVAPMGMKFKR